MTDATSKSLALLRELASLLDKYGGDAFTDLARTLSDPVFAHDVAVVLDEIASRAPKARKRRRPSVTEARAAFRSNLVQLRETEPERGGQLVELYDVLQSKNALPTLRELVAFASDHGFEPPKAKSRDKAVMAFVKTCASLNAEELVTLLAELRPEGDGGDRTLADWGRVILSSPRELRNRSVDPMDTETEQEDGRGR